MSPRRVLLACAIAIAASGLSSPAPSTAAVPPGVRVIAQRGFGDSRNSYSWSMAWFKGKLYVGTSRQMMCVENVTIDFYLPVLDLYRRNLAPNVRCPRYPRDLDLRAEIWRYTPSTDSWRMVYRSPADIPNPRAPGGRVARDIAYRGMVVGRDGRGRPTLYVGGVTADEFLPTLRKPHPPRILHTVDGVHFAATEARDVVIHVPYGTFRPIGFRSMVNWRNRLYVTASGGLTGDGAILRVDRPWSTRPRFRQVSLSSMAVFEIQPFNGDLYAGTGDSQVGYGVWRTRRNGRSYRSYHWKPIITGGAGRGKTMTSVVSMHVFRGELYVGSSGWYNHNELPLSELVRVNRNDRWSVVAGNPRMAGGVYRAPISGLHDGFDNMFAAHFWRMNSRGGTMYLATNDWSWMLQVDHRYPVLQSLFAGEFGFDVWATCDGRYWFAVTRDAFGGNMYDFGGRNIVSTPDGVFFGSANHAQGTTVWRDTAPYCSSLVRSRGAARAADTRAAKPIAPQRLLVDVQRHGAVVSWARPAGQPRGARYEVQRAAYSSLPLDFDAPPVLRGGFRLEDQLPIPSAPGTPGTVRVTIPAMDRFQAIGSTSRGFFVDHSRVPGARYAYQVVARVQSGARSHPSNMQVVPDPRPVPTFARLMRMLHRAPARAAVAGRALAAWRRRDPSAALLRLGALRASRAPDGDLDDLLVRLQRRLRYGHVAGGW
jgi:hypothetical protein